MLKRREELTSGFMKRVQKTVKCQGKIKKRLGNFEIEDKCQPCPVMQLCQFLIYVVSIKGIGAVYAPCMREDFSVQHEYSMRNYSMKDPLGCCEIASRNVAGTMTEHECAQRTEGMQDLLLFFHKNIRWGHSCSKVVPLFCA